MHLDSPSFPCLLDNLIVSQEPPVRIGRNPPYRAGSSPYWDQVVTPTEERVAPVKDVGEVTRCHQTDQAHKATRRRRPNTVPLATKRGTHATSQSSPTGCKPRTPAHIGTYGRLALLASSASCANGNEEDSEHSKDHQRSVGDVNPNHQSCGDYRKDDADYPHDCVSQVELPVLIEAYDLQSANRQQPPISALVGARCLDQRSFVWSVVWFLLSGSGSNEDGPQRCGSRLGIVIPAV